MKIVGIAGTAKNTGKTTTTMTLIETACEQGVPLAVTSIGLDGEELDQVTGLPKPRLELPAGAFLVTAEHCISGGTAELEVLKELRAQTPLGKLQLARVLQKGRVLMAGPNNQRDLNEVAQSLEGREADVLLVDGALNRMAPLAGTDLFVLATGAARSNNLAALQRETQTLVRVLKLPGLPPREKSTFSYILNNRGIKGLGTDSLLSRERVERIFSSCREVKEIFIRGVLTGEAFSRLGSMINPEGCRLIISNPINLLLGEDLKELDRAVEVWQKAGGELGVEFPLDLRAVTINPFFPDWQEKGGFYQPRYVEEEALKRYLSSLKVPVINVVREGGSRLWSTVFGEN